MQKISNKFVLIINLIILTTSIFLFLNIGYISPEEDVTENKILQDLTTYRTALEVYKIENGIYPSNKQGVRALFDNPITESHDNYKKVVAIYESIKYDPWEREYNYKNIKNQNESFTMVFTYGRDGKVGGIGENEDKSIFIIE